MERVRDIATVAHHWANQIGDKANASNLFFEEGNIFSYGYHFLIAKHVVNSSGGHAVLITQRKYSRSTSAHVTLVWQASRHIQQLSVPDPELPPEELFEKWLGQIKGIAGSLNNSRKPEKYILKIRQVYGQAERYATFFGYELPEVLQQAGTVENEEQYRDVIRIETQLHKAQAKKERAAALRIQKVALKRWRVFEINDITTSDGFDYLRLNQSSQRIETTQRVEIPLAIAQQFYRHVLETIAQGGCTKCREKLMDGYEVLEINSRFIRVGCYKISLKEIRSFADHHGWL